MAVETTNIEKDFAKKVKWLNLSPKYEDTDFIARQVSKRRLTQAQADLILLLREAAEIAYPGKWDIQFDYTIDYKIESSSGYGYWELDPEKFNHTLTSYGFTETELFRLPSNYVLDYVYHKTVVSDRPYDFRIKVSQVKLVIHFPEVTITNKFKQSHDIKDLFIALNFNHRGEATTDIQGTRSSYSELEVIYSYVHSHLRSMDFQKKDMVMEWQSFCKGSGSINACLSLYNSDKSIGNLLSLLYHLNSTANHESIDGGPHYRMETLMAKEGLATAPTGGTLNDVCQRIINNTNDVHYYRNLSPIKVDGNEVKMLPLDWKYEGGKYLIVDNDKLNEFCVYYIKHNSKYSSAYCIFKADNGQYYKKPSSITFHREDYPEYENFVPFRGRKYEFAVYSKPGPVITDKKVYIHPEIRKYVKQQLESYAAKATFKQSAIERLDQVSNH